LTAPTGSTRQCEAGSGSAAAAAPPSSACRPAWAACPRGAAVLPGTKDTVAPARICIRQDPGAPALAQAQSEFRLQRVKLARSPPLVLPPYTDENSGLGRRLFASRRGAVGQAAQAQARPAGTSACRVGSVSTCRLPARRLPRPQPRMEPSDANSGRGPAPRRRHADETRGAGRRCAPRALSSKRSSAAGEPHGLSSTACTAPSSAIAGSPAAQPSGRPAGA